MELTVVLVVPSVYTSWNGAVPANVMVRVLLDPSQMTPPPDNIAVGAGRKLTATGWMIEQPSAEVPLI
jgi:hypothetical protein